MALRDKLARWSLKQAGVHAPIEQRGHPSIDDAQDAVLAGEHADAEVATVVRGERIARLRALISEVASREKTPRRVRRSPRERQALPFGQERELLGGGRGWLVERYLEPHHQHGRIGVARTLALDPELIARLALDPQLCSASPSGMLFLDTETTGLAGGTGTVPFLIGLAFFEDGVLKLEQLFLRELGAEAPLLAHVAARVAQASAVVSYNGKSFDWPLVRTRAILNRVPLPEPAAHLDLLHCTRRILREALESVRLCEVERALCGFEREDDVSGALIPGLYLEYLRGGDPEPLSSVLEHNAHDLIALAALLPRMTEHFAEVHLEDDPVEHLAYAHVAARAGDDERATRFAGAVEQVSQRAELRASAAWLSASVSRRRGEHEVALASLLRMLEHAQSVQDIARAHHALAKHYEHRARDLARAYHHARFTLELEGAELHGRRLGRLHRRLLSS